jgi:hypothetical protein
MLRRKLNDPVFLLALVAALGAFAVQSGELGSSDTTHRLQVAHSFWTPESWRCSSAPLICITRKT